MMQRPPIGQVQVQLIISVVDGRPNLEGPLGDKVLCYGLLERAKDAVREFDASKASRLIVPRNGHPQGLS